MARSRKPPPIHRETTIIPMLWWPTAASPNNCFLSRRTRFANVRELEENNAVLRAVGERLRYIDCIGIVGHIRLFDDIRFNEGRDRPGEQQGDNVARPLWTARTRILA